MIDSYLQNSSIGMTKDQYLDMCEMLGSTPIESEMPVEFDDFPLFIQQIFEIYRLMGDIWEPMNGTYLGKDTSILFNLLDLYLFDKEEQRICLQIIQKMDDCRSDMLAKNKKPQSK